MNTRLLGAQMTVSFNARIMLLVLLSTNIGLASCYSRDGAASYLNKIQPTGYLRLLLAKLVPSLCIGFVGTGVAVWDYSRFLLGKGSLAMTPKDIVCFGVAIFAVFAAHVFWSAEMDIMNPQYTQYATFNDQANNPNENKSALLVFLLSFAVFVLSLFFDMDDSSAAWMKIMIIACVLAALKVVTFCLKVNTFYKEK